MTPQSTDMTSVQPLRIHTLFNTEYPRDWAHILKILLAPLHIAPVYYPSARRTLDFPKIN